MLFKSGLCIYPIFINQSKVFVGAFGILSVFVYVCEGVVCVCVCVRVWCVCVFEGVVCVCVCVCGVVCVCIENFSLISSCSASLPEFACIISRTI